MADSPSSQYSIHGLADLVVNLPDSDGGLDPQASSEEGFFDINILISKLEAYKASLEVVRAQLRRKRSINPREVSEVTAAARLKLRLDGRPPASSESHDNSVLTSPTALAFPSSVSNTSSSSETSYFDLITPDDHEEVPVAVLSGNTARDTWKSSHSVTTEPKEKNAYGMPTRPNIPLRSPGRPLLETRSARPTAVDSQVKSMFSSPLASPAFAASDWVGAQNISSLKASESDNGRKSIDQMSMCPPDEDRIRREIESYTIKDWVDSEDVKQLEVIASARQPAGAQVIPLSDQVDGEVLELPRTRPGTSARPTEQYAFRRTTFRDKFGSLWHRRTKAEKIIELYLDMDTSP